MLEGVSKAMQDVTSVPLWVFFRLISLCQKLRLHPENSSIDTFNLLDLSSNLSRVLGFSPLSDVFASVKAKL